MNTLKYLQSNEFLLDVDLWRLFANLEELNKVSRKRELLLRSEINQPNKRIQQTKSFYLVSMLTFGTLFKQSTFFSFLCGIISVLVKYHQCKSSSCLSSQRYMAF